MVKIKHQLFFSLVMCIGICMTGCNQNSKSESDSESADITAFTEAIPETINMETEIPTEAKPDYNEIYYEYIQNELIPVYGLAALDVPRDYAAPSNTPHTELLGIVSAEIYDFGNDEKAELLTVTREQNVDEPYGFTVYLNLYAYESNEVVNKDRISLDSYSMYSGGEHGDQSDLCIYGDVIFQHLDTFRYASSGPYATCNEYTIIDVTDNKFTKEVIQANEIQVMVRDTEQVLYHCEDICSNYGGCSDYTDKRDINQANDVLKELFEEKHFSNFEGINLNNNAFITLKINGTPDVKIMDYTSIKSFYTTDHTGLRDHISVQTEPTEQQNYTGRYVGDSWRIDVMDSQITVEMISDGEAVSIVNHSGVISSNMTFEETDRFSKNRYEVTFGGDNIHLTANCIEFYNELADWAIPDTDVTLSKISDTVPDMDISQWSDEKLASAINYYMSRRDYTNGYYVVPNEIQHNDDGIKVYAHNGLGNSKNEYYVRGAKGNDIVCLALNYTGIAEFFHLTDCDSSYKSPYLNSIKIYSCDKKGEINGTDVAGFAASYVCEEVRLRM